MLIVFLTRPSGRASAATAITAMLSSLGVSLSIFLERVQTALPPQELSIPWLSVDPSAPGLATLYLGIYVDNLAALMLAMVCFIALLIQIYSYSYITIEVGDYPAQSSASVSIHAATMVAAGVYMVARMAPVFALPDAHQAAMVVAWTGAITALVAGSLALVQNDIKKILAYSTVSQLGFMLTALGAGATNAGVFHLITHAFFKALLFLGSGAVIVACHNNDIWKMGGLTKRLPATHWSFLFGSLALSGLPPFAGFWSKDEILGGLTHQPALLAILTLTAFLTAFYVGRLYCVAFLGEYRGNREDLTMGGPIPPAHLTPPISPAKTIFDMQPFWSEERAMQDKRHLPPECLGALSEGTGHGLHEEASPTPTSEESATHLEGVDRGEHYPHEVSPMMYVPLLILAVFAVLLGLVGMPGEHNLFAHFVFPTAKHEPVNYVLMVGSAVVALAGLLGAWSMFAARPEEGEARLHKLLGPMLPVLQQKYYMDHLWAKALAYFLYVDAKILSRFDEQAVDGVVYGVGDLTYQAGQLVRNEQNGQLQRYAITLVIGFFLLIFSMILFEPQFLWDHLAPFQRMVQILHAPGGPDQ